MYAEMNLGPHLKKCLNFAEEIQGLASERHYNLIVQLDRLHSKKRRCTEAVVTIQLLSRELGRLRP